MKLTAGTFCPLIKGECKQMQCSWFRAFPVRETATGIERDEWDCAIRWLPFLLRDTVHRTEGVGAAIESFRNEVAKGQRDAALGIVRAHSVPEPKLIEAAE